MRAVESAEEGLEPAGARGVLHGHHRCAAGRHERLRVPGQSPRTQWPDLPVLMITAYATPKLAVEAIKAGAIDYLAKPFAPEELLHAVARCAERYRLLAGKRRAARPRRRDLSARTDRRRMPEDARAAAADPDRRAHRRARADPGRKRHGQGTGGRRAAQPEPAPRGQLRPHQLRRHSRNAAGKRIVRPREGRVHRRARSRSPAASRKPTAARSSWTKSRT